MRYKKAKLAIASILMASLTACANNENNLGSPRNVSTGDLKHPIQNTDLSNPNPNRNSIYPLKTSMEVHRVNNGFLTIDQNSYSTGIPSSQFPHSSLVHNGQFWYYTFVPAGQAQTGTMNQGRAGNIAAPMSPSRLPTTAPAPAKTGINQVTMKVIELTNNQRRKYGLAPLSADTALSRVAQTKTNEMNSKHYFSHTSPTYGSPFDMMRDFGVTYRSAGENIAMGQPTAQQVVTAWMNSEGHRKNILSPNYTSIGVGYTANGNYWSQMFIGK